MPYPTKKSQLEEARKHLAKASYLLSQDEGHFEEGLIALEAARAIISDLTGDIEGARSARRTIENLSILLKSSKSVTIAEAISASSDPR